MTLPGHFYSCVTTDLVECCFGDLLDSMIFISLFLVSLDIECRSVETCEEVGMYFFSYHSNSSIKNISLNTAKMVSPVKVEPCSAGGIKCIYFSEPTILLTPKSYQI